VKNLYRWPTHPDILWVNKENIPCKLYTLQASGKTAALFEVKSGWISHYWKHFRKSFNICLELFSNSIFFSVDPNCLLEWSFRKNIISAYITLRFVKSIHLFTVTIIIISVLFRIKKGFEYCHDKEMWIFTLP
jgi:hypothetical protein